MLVSPKVAQLSWEQPITYFFFLFKAWERILGKKKPATQDEACK